MCFLLWVFLSFTTGHEFLVKLWEFNLSSRFYLLSLECVYVCKWSSWDFNLFLKYFMCICRDAFLCAGHTLLTLWHMFVHNLTNSSFYFFLTCHTCRHQSLIFSVSSFWQMLSFDSNFDGIRAVNFLLCSIWIVYMYFPIVFFCMCHL